MLRFVVPVSLLLFAQWGCCEELGLQNASTITRTPLHILGLYPMTGAWAGGQAQLPATLLALRDVNANPNILPGYEVIITPRDTECDDGVAIDVMYRELYNATRTSIMILGGGCSVATEATAQASHHWNLVQLSYSASSPKLSERSLYPKFFRLFPPESAFNVVKLAFLREFGWVRVATLHQSIPLFSLATSDFQRDARLEGLEIIATEIFADNPETHVENLKNAGARIIIGGFYSDIARKIFCAAYRNKLYGAEYVWILRGWFENQWWQKPDESIDCTAAQMDEVAAYHFTVFLDTRGTMSAGAPPWKPSETGQTADGFLEDFHEEEGESANTLVGYSEITLGYDSVWAAAFALHVTEKQLQRLDPPKTLADFTYTDETIGDMIFDSMDNLMFKGISGPVTFSATGDPKPVLVLQQIQDGSIVRVGIVDPAIGSGQELTRVGLQPIYWKGGVPPVDSTTELEDRRNLPFPIFLAGTIFSIAGILLATIFLAFNIYFRKMRVIKMSSPNINNLLLIGGMLSYFSIIFLGIDTALTSTETFVWMCKVSIWCLTIGFSLAFGSMFIKMWRVHKIFTSKTVIKTVVKDYMLFGFVATLVLVDVALLVIWEIFDPLQAVEMYGTKVVDSEDEAILYTPVRTVCVSDYQIYFIGAFYLIDGLLLVFGALLAWETRHVSIPAPNDSKYIDGLLPGIIQGFSGAFGGRFTAADAACICVYIVLLLSFVGASVSFVLEERNAHYILVATLVWLATTITLCVVFVSKIITRNDVSKTSALTQDQPNSNVAGTPEIQLLREELSHMRKNCKCTGQGNTGGEETENSPTAEANINGGSSALEDGRY